MTSAIERTARALATLNIPAYADAAIWADDLRLLHARDKRKGANPFDNPFGLARVALTAYLDPADEEMVERVARAMCASRLHADAWGLLNDESRGTYCKIARAAIAALREMATSAKGPGQ